MIEADGDAQLTDGRPAYRRALAVVPQGDATTGTQASEPLSHRRAQAAVSGGLPLLTFDFPSARVTLRGLTLQHTSGAPAVEVRSGTVVISECIFANNTDAGAVRLVGGDVTIANSQFQRNGCGAEPSLATPRDVCSPSFPSCSTCLVPPVTTIPSTPDNANPTGDGGAIDVLGGVVVVSNSSFRHNTAQRGGAVHVSGVSSPPLLRVYRSSFDLNSASVEGGALSVGEAVVTLSDRTVLRSNT